MKILNLYACLGGNRYKWDEVANYKYFFGEDSNVDLNQYVLRGVL